MKIKLIFAAYMPLIPEPLKTAETVWGKAYPYLQSVPSPGDKLSPDYQSEARFSSEEFSSKLASVVEGLKLEGDAASWVTGEPVRSSAGTVTALTVGGQTLTGRQIREALGLRSAFYRFLWRRWVCFFGTGIWTRGRNEPVWCRLHGQTGVHME